MIDKLCRFCLESNENLLSLHATDKDLVNKAKICLNIQVCI